MRGNLFAGQGKLTIPELPAQPKTAHLLGGEQKKLDVIEGSGGDANAIEVPAEAPDANDSVIVLECE